MGATMGFNTLVNECDSLIDLLKKYQTLCSEVDLRTTDISERIKFVKSQEGPFTNKVSERFNKIWEYVSPFIGTEQFEKTSEFMDRKLKRYFYVGESYNKRVYDKPLGYNGDYLTIYHLFLKYTGQSTYEILINQYSRNIPVALGYYYRIDFLMEEFKKYTNKNVLSVGSGPVIELQRYAQFPEFENINFSLLDMEARALDFVKATLGRRFQNIRYFEFSAFSFIRALSKNKLKLDNQDLIYSCGLFDYLEDKVGKLIINGLYDKLNKGGKLFITNISSDVTEKAYFQILGKWNLILRDEAGLLSLAEQCLKKNNFRIYRDKYSNSCVFLEIDKV
jgi:extracellular factor (EF) 3-hydroxypalmitic acid methyl ester biosynthesis protein